VMYRILALSMKYWNTTCVVFWRHHFATRVCAFRSTKYFDFKRPSVDKRILYRYNNMVMGPFTMGVIYYSKPIYVPMIIRNWPIIVDYLLIFDCDWSIIYNLLYSITPFIRWLLNLWLTQKRKAVRCMQ